MKTILETIDTRYGTDNSHSFSHGNTLPYTGAPFCMNYFVPQSSHTDGAWFFKPDLPIFQGIRLTHQPSPWIGDFSWLLLTPVTENISKPDIYHRQSSYRTDESIFQPHYLKIHSNRYQVSTELTPTTYGACFRLTSQLAQPISLILHSEAQTHFRMLDAYTLIGSLKEETNTAKQALTMYVCLRFDQPIQASHALGEDLVLDFERGQLQFALATSFISEEQAVTNLPQADFDRVKEQTKQAWESYLHRFDIVEQGKVDRRIFDQTLYRLFLFPQTFYEITPEGQEIHWDFTHHTIQSGKFYTNIGFWDGFRTNFPLLALIAPDIYHDFLEGFLNFYKETGYMRAKDRQGQFRSDFSPYSWGRDYAECSAMQNTLSAFHDIEGLKELMGGEPAFTDYLTRLCQDQPYFDVRSYGYEIHEMSEMANAHFGQLAISNQPSFHIPYLFRYSAKPEYTSLLIKSLREGAFQAGWQAFPGDEDNGSLYAWYIWSVLGLYPTCPGKPHYDLGIPLFDHLRLYLPQSQKWLDIYAHDNYPHFQFVKKVELDGRSQQRISHEDLLASDRLDFYLSWLPNSSSMHS